MIINDEMTEAYNSKIQVDLNKLKKMTPSQLDRVKSYGSAAENLLTNKDFALFVHHYKFDLMEQMSAINGYTAEADAHRIAAVHNMNGINSFIASLQKATWYKNKVVVSQQPQVEDPAQ